MKGFYDHLKIEQGICPEGCSACEKACASERGEGTSGRIKPVHCDRAGFHGVVTCIQCSRPVCGQVCPTGAIGKSEVDGVVRIEKEKCIGCGMCTLECPYGGIYFDPVKGKAYKCDTCDGKPKCLEACEQAVLSFVKSRPVYSYLHEDLVIPGNTFCLGCAADLAFRFMMRVLGGKDCILFGAPGCAGTVTGGMMMMMPTKIAAVFCLMTNVPSVMTGVKRYFRKKGKDITCVAFVGDGATADVGFQPLSGAAERGENLIYVCYDNEGYMNTGIQRSSTTPFGGWTTTTPTMGKGKGKERASKDVPLIMAAHNIPYVATVTPAHPEDFAQKLIKAKAVKDGLSYIHVFSPCPTGWRASPDSVIDLCRMAVETNYFPLWEMERGTWRLTYQVKHPKPIQEFTRLMGRFSHLQKEEYEELQEMVDSKLRLIQGHVRISDESNQDEGERIRRGC